MSGATSVAVASCREAIEHARDEDEPALLDALRSEGFAVHVLAWDDPGAPWDELDVVLVRSTWDYTSRRDEFLQWAAQVARVSRLLNDAPTLEWNTDKRYLGDLAAAGLPVVPTRILEPGDAVELGPPAELVVKPTVSAGSQDTGRYPSALRGRAEAHAARLLGEGRSVLVQPYLDAVDHQGESALVYLDGRYSHALRKGALLAPGGAPVDGLFAAEQISVRPATAAEREVAERTLEALPVAAPPLYARIDLLADEHGAPTILEVELTEPSLFFAHVPDAAPRLATALARRLS